MKTALPIAITLLIGSVAWGCNIPVFRYALERWQPDQAEVWIVHDGPLSTEHQQLVKQLAAESSDLGGTANAKVMQVPLQTATAEQRQLWKSLQSGNDVELPHVIVRAAIGKGRRINAWHGSLQSTAQVGVLRSPVRDKLAERLLAGDSIVWLVIGSDDPDRNAAIAEQLRSRFEPLQNKIALPEGIGLPGSELHSEIPLLVRYSLLEVDRDDPAEQVLVQMLAGMQPSAFAAGQPLVVPVFGRGRALEVIPAESLDPQLMEQLAVFLSGACSCQVKERNPGFDLLLAADWTRELFGDQGEPPPAVTGQNRSAPTLLTIPPGN